MRLDVYEVRVDVHLAEKVVHQVLNGLKFLLGQEYLIGVNLHWVSIFGFDESVRPFCIRRMRCNNAQPF